MFQIAEQAGVAAGLREAWHLLSMQMTYSALHGIGTIELPILKFEFSTDYTASEVRLLRKGLSGEAPTPAIPARASDPTSWEDNGFSSPDGMNGAHSTVAAAFGNTLNGFGPTLDLGCGDGALLERLRKRNGLERVVGVEVDEGRVSRGAKRFSEVDLWLGRIEDVNLWSGEEWQTIILMPGRLLEMKPPLADAFREALRRSAKRLLLYAYDDWAEGGLAALCVRAGLPPPSKIIKGHGRVVEAGV
jgi:SAM-dependent methyltransferase